MIDKFVRSMADAMDGIRDGSTVLIAGFAVGQPNALIEGLIEQGARDLTIVANAGGRAGTETPFARLFALGRVRKLVCSFVRAASMAGERVRSGEVELEIVPQGTLAERIRAAGAGVSAFYTPTGAETLIAEGREVRNFRGRPCLLEHAIEADVGLVEAWQADRWGNLTFKDSARNFNPIVAMAARLTVVQTQHRAELGELDPEAVHTPGIFVDRVLHLPYGAPPEFTP